jgi:hypothetical protein
MNDLHVTEKAMAETGKTANAEDIDLPYARSADQLPTRVDPDEDSGNRKFHTGGGLEDRESTNRSLCRRQPEGSKNAEARFSPGTPVVLISGYALLPPQELSRVDAHVGKDATLDISLDKVRALVVAHESSLAAASGSLESEMRPNFRRSG